MSKLTALSISIALLGGIWAFLALGPLAGFVLVWAGFIAWRVSFILVRICQHCKKPSSA